MINVKGIQIDVADSLDRLSEEWAIFTIEFEYDAKIMVHHTFGNSVYTELNRLIKSMLSSRCCIPEQLNSLVNSKFLTVEVKEVISSKSTIEVLKRKYELIDEYQSYAPYGHNYLRDTKGTEKVFASSLMQQLVYRVRIPEKMIPVEESCKKGRLPEPVYQYDKTTGILIRGFESTREASEQTGLCISNINMCCNKHIKSSGGYIWSRNKSQVIEIPEDRRRKEPTPPPTKEELAKRIQEKQLAFISKNFKTKEQQAEEEKYKAIKS